MRAAGRTSHEIAKKLGRTEAAIRQLVYVGRMNGWLDDQDEPVDVEAELAINVDRKVVRNINHALDGGMTNYQTHEMTLAAAKGRGIFKTHEVTKQDGQAPLSVVAIQVVMPSVGAGDQMPDITEDQMGGVPAYIEGEVDGDLDTRPALEAAQPGPEPEVLVGAQSDGPQAVEGDADRSGTGDTVADDATERG